MQIIKAALWRRKLLWMNVQKFTNIVFHPPISSAYEGRLALAHWKTPCKMNRELQLQRKLESTHSISTFFHSLWRKILFEMLRRNYAYEKLVTI